MYFYLYLFIDLYSRKIVFDLGKWVETGVLLGHQSLGMWMSGVVS